MLSSKFLTATFTALAVVGTAGLVYAQTSSSTDPVVQMQPATPGSTGDMTGNANTATPGTGAMNRSTDTLNQGSNATGQGGQGQATDAMNQRNSNLGQSSDTANQRSTTLGQGAATTTPGGSSDQQLAARADRN